MALLRRHGFVVWEGGWVPRGVDGIALGRLVIVRRGRLTPYVERHEAVHVRQWKRFGWIGFPTRYAATYLRWRLRGKDHRGAYLRIPMEIEADWVARRSLGTAATEVRGRVGTG